MPFFDSVITTARTAQWGQSFEQVAFENVPLTISQNISYSFNFQYVLKHTYFEFSFAHIIQNAKS